jgi:hypothetical protein
VISCKLDLSVCRSLHILVGEWLFAARCWPPPAVKVNRALATLGLTMAVDQRTSRKTPLGQAVGVDVWMLWLGAWDLCDICFL